MTTAANYALSGLIDWQTAGEFGAGGAAGGWLGTRSAVRLSSKRRMLTHVFAGVIFAVAGYMLFRTGMNFVKQAGRLARRTVERRTALRPHAVSQRVRFALLIGTPTIAADPVAYAG